jgi:hypothetical protein
MASFRRETIRERSGAMGDPKATPFLTDIKELQRRAREHVEKGAVTPAYRGDIETSVRLLNEALATEIKEDLIAERIAIESYMEMIRYFGDDDPTSRRLMEGVLEQ